MTSLGIDIGTSGVKALLIDEAGRPLADATAPAVEPVRPHPGWSEQDPADWWQATLAAVDALSQSHPEALAALQELGVLLALMFALAGFAIALLAEVRLLIGRILVFLRKS